MLKKEFGREHSRVFCSIHFCHQDQTWTRLYVTARPHAISLKTRSIMNKGPECVDVPNVYLWSSLSESNVFSKPHFIRTKQLSMFSATTYRTLADNI